MAGVCAAIKWKQRGPEGHALFRGGGGEEAPAPAVSGGLSAHRDGIARLGAAGPGPLDTVLDDPALEGVTGDSKQLSGFDDATGRVERFHAEEAFGGIEVQVFEDEAHGGRIGQGMGTGKDVFVSRHPKRTVV